MRRPTTVRVTLVTGLLALLLAALAAPVGAHPRVELDPTLPTDVTFAATDNIEYLGRFPEHTGTAGGRLVDDRFYITDPRGVYVYDVTDPASPDLLGSLLLPQRSTGAALAQEDVDTDGNILLVDAVDPDDPQLKADTNFGTLQVVDVSDPTNLEVIGTADVADHTWNCVSARINAEGEVDPEGEMNHCAFAYGRTGHIVDLTDPTDPVVLDATWRSAIDRFGDRSNSPYTHDLTEIRPGLVMSAGAENVLMDTTDPRQPIELTRVRWFPVPRFTSLGYHQVEWHNDGTDPIAVFGTEIAPSGPTNAAGSDCDADQEGGENSVVETWDASAVVEGLELYEEGLITAEQFREDHQFELIDAYDAGSRGLFIDGEAPAHRLYCAHWFEFHPDFDGQGLLAVSYYDRGTRFVEIDETGHMEEVGWIVPAEGYSGSPQWISDEVVYIMDYRRGLEIIRIDTGSEATSVYQNDVDVIAAGSSIQPVGAESDDTGLMAVTVGLGLALAALGMRRRRRVVGGVVVR